MLEHYAAGATVVLQALQFSDPVFAELSTNLALELDHPVQVNAYLTPPAERGLDIHFDFHDVSSCNSPAASAGGSGRRCRAASVPSSAARRSRQPSADELGDALLDRVLERGDCLADSPRASRTPPSQMDAESAHLTIGIMALTWNRVLRDVIDDIASGSALADRLPFGGLGGLDTAGRPLPAAALGCPRRRNSPTIRLRHAVAAEVWRRQPQTRLRPRRPVTIDLRPAGLR